MFCKRKHGKHKGAAQATSHAVDEKHHQVLQCVVEVVQLRFQQIVDRNFDTNAHHVGKQNQRRVSLRDLSEQIQLHVASLMDIVCKL